MALLTLEILFSNFSRHHSYTNIKLKYKSEKFGIYWDFIDFSDFVQNISLLLLFLFASASWNSL